LAKEGQGMSKKIDFQLIPKVELHRHLDCSMRFSTMLEIAQALGLVSQKYDLAEVRENYLITKPFRDLPEVLNKFGRAQKLLHSEEILERLAFECVEDMYRDGIRIAELRYSPNFIQGANRSFNFNQIHEAFCRGVDKAVKIYSMAVGFIVIIQRTLNPEQANEVLDFVMNRPKMVYGIDMADDETCDALPFLPLFEKAKKQGFKLTMHAGEMPLQKSTENMYSAVNEFEVSRIGHGIQAIHDDKLCRLLIEKNIVLENCPTSNVLTQGVVDLNHHPIRKFFDRGVPITVSTDDPGIFDFDLTSEYKKLNSVHGMIEHDFQILNKTAFNASFIPDAIKNKFKELFI
jgi:adenosine deaminase